MKKLIESVIVEVFSPEQIYYRSLRGNTASKGAGIFFTIDEDEAKRYGSTVQSAKLDINNPYYPTPAEQKFLAMSGGNELIRWQKDIAYKARKYGHDGIIYPGNYVVVFDPKQIKDMGA